MAVETPVNRGGETLIVVRGTYGRGESDRVHDLLAQCDRDIPVTIDFHEVRLFDLCAVGRLADELARVSGPRINLRGLSEHHHRLLRHLGLGRG